MGGLKGTISVCARQGNCQRVVSERDDDSDGDSDPQEPPRPGVEGVSGTLKLRAFAASWGSPDVPHTIMRRELERNENELKTA